MTKALMLIVLLVATSCATAPPPYQTPASVVWAYDGFSQAIPAIKIIAYAPSDLKCQIMLKNDENLLAQQRKQGADFLKMTVLNQCHPTVLSSGAEWWVFSVVGYPSTWGVGANTKEICESLRVEAKKKAPHEDQTSCGPVSLRALR